MGNTNLLQLLVERTTGTLVERMTGTLAGITPRPMETLVERTTGTLAGIIPRPMDTLVMMVLGAAGSPELVVVVVAIVLTVTNQG